MAPHGWQTAELVIVDWTMTDGMRSKSLYAHAEVADQQGKPPSCYNDQQETFPLLCMQTSDSGYPRSVPCGKTNSNAFHGV